MFRDDIVKGDHRGTRVGGRSEIRSRGFREADKTQGSFPRWSGNMPHHRAILDHQARPSCLGEDRVWRCLLEMGLEGGEMPGRAEGDLGSMQAICYAAVIVNELMRCQEGLEDWVRPGDRERSGLS